MRIKSIPVMMLWVVVVFVAGNVCFGQSYWKRTYGDLTEITSINPTYDGNYLLGGWTYTSSLHESLDICLIKVNSDGDTLWTKTYGGTGLEYLNTIVPTMDGNYLLGGVISSDNEAPYNGLLIKITPDGDTLWTKMYGGADWNCLNAIFPTADGNFLLAGSTNIISAGADDGWLLKVNPDGDTLWTKTYGGTGCDWLTSIHATSDGNFLLMGSTRSFGAGMDDGWLLKINQSGDTIWTKTFGGSYDDNLYTNHATPDGNYLLVGNTSAPKGVDSYRKGWLLKINSDGDTLWTKTYGDTSEVLLSIIYATPDGNYLLMGTSGHFEEYGGFDIWLLKINPDGDTLWTKTYGKTENEVLKMTLETSHGIILLVGSEAGLQHAGLICLIDDQYAYKDTPFTFKIPTGEADSLDFGYFPLKTPPGMNVSPGGIISWTPETDSIYMEHVEYIVLNDFGRKDTLTFNLFVNSDSVNYHTKCVSKYPIVCRTLQPC